MPKRRNQDRPAFTQTCIACPSPLCNTHGTFTTTAQSRPPPLLQQTGRGAAHHQGEFRHNQPHPASSPPSIIITLPTSSSSSTQQPWTTISSACWSPPGTCVHVCAVLSLLLSPCVCPLLFFLSSQTPSLFCLPSRPPPSTPASPLFSSRLQHVAPLVSAEGQGLRPALPALQDLPGPEARHGLQAGAKRRRLLRGRLRNEKGNEGGEKQEGRREEKIDNKQGRKRSRHRQMPSSMNKHVFISCPLSQIHRQKTRGS